MGRGICNSNLQRVKNWTKNGNSKGLEVSGALTLLAICCIAGIVDVMDDFQADEAQRAQHECKSNIPQCHPNAYCYGNDTSYECMCIPGWDGDGFVGDGHSGCQRRQLSKLQLAAYILAFTLAALVSLWFLVDVIRACIKLVRARMGNEAQLALAQQAHHPQQGVAPGPAEAV